MTVMACLLCTSAFAVIFPTPGVVSAFGDGPLGQLGHPGTTNSAVPVSVVDTGGANQLADVVAIANGQNHGMALLTDGTVVAWGSNVNGRLGNNSTTDSNIPVHVVGVGGTGLLQNVRAIAAGTHHSLALLTDGTVVAWGNNSNGQLGNGGISESHVPVPVVGVGGTGTLQNVIGLAGGFGHSAALLSDGSVVAWGYNAGGALGDNTSVEKHFPVQVHGIGDVGTLGGVTAITAGAFFTAGRRSDGSVVTWGVGTSGELGNNGLANSLVPVQVHGLGDVGTLGSVVAISSGWSHTLAVRANGTVVGWGDNSRGQLGDTTTNRALVPVQMVGVGGTGLLGGAVGASGGTVHTLVLLGDGGVVATGADDVGQLGDNGLGTDKSSPVQVKGLGGTGTLAYATQLSVGATASFSTVLSSTAVAVSQTIGADGLSRVLFRAPGNTSNGVYVNRISADGRTVSQIARLSAPGGAGLAKQMVRDSSGNLAILFVDSLTSATQFALATVPEGGGSAVLSALTAAPGPRLSLVAVGTALWLMSTSPSVGSDPTLTPVTSVANGVPVGLGAGTTVTNPNASATDGDLAVGVVSGVLNEFSILYQTYTSGVATGWQVAVYTTGLAADAVTARVSTVGVPVDLAESGVGEAVVLSVTGAQGTSHWTVSRIALTNGAAPSATSSHAAQDSGGSLGQLQAAAIAISPASPNEPRLLMVNQLTWLRKHLGLGTVVESRPGSGRVWKLDPTTLNPTWASLAFREPLLAG
ncbi:MAG TPA: hypothetical protein VGN26_01590 [Armatimonadota bacterium]